MILRKWRVGCVHNRKCFLNNGTTRGTWLSNWMPALLCPACGSCIRKVIKIVSRNLIRHLILYNSWNVELAIVLIHYIQFITKHFTKIKCSYTILRILRRTLSSMTGPSIATKHCRKGIGKVAKVVKQAYIVVARCQLPRLLSTFIINGLVLILSYGMSVDSFFGVSYIVHDVILCFILVTGGVIKSEYHCTCVMRTCASEKYNITEYNRDKDYLWSGVPSINLWKLCWTFSLETHAPIRSLCGTHVCTRNDLP